MSVWGMRGFLSEFSLAFLFTEEGGVEADDFAQVQDDCGTG